MISPKFQPFILKTTNNKFSSYQILIMICDKIYGKLNQIQKMQENFIFKLLQKSNILVVVKWFH